MMILRKESVREQKCNKQERARGSDYQIMRSTMCNTRKVDHGLLDDPEIMSLAGGSAMLALDVGSQFILETTRFGLALIAGPHSNERETWLGC